MLSSALSGDLHAHAKPEHFAMRLLDAEGRAALVIAQGLRGQAMPVGMPRADIALFLSAADQRTTVNALHFQRLYDLTPAETRLAECLALGQSLAEIGERFHVSRETLKTQLRSLFGKTRTSRQGELVARLLSSITVPLI